ncbi:putative metal-binding protein [Sulfuricella denitrificans skB26]|uniref:Putative metal-binding protein n=1 Tax=Sulfuricella denitrificans (strain DSM 22764 / NBRC 105220 / skB26) TaxID=1163617 RepID=S6A9F4_SULDS|nr:DUF411 domain-containing protein [Sulfuricella denitrificans]BAN34015.1 putative metal-binding protein [Sulfuricella denitrificans skB26]
MLKRVILATTLALSLNGAQAVEAGGMPAIEVYGPVGCLSCMEYIYHLGQNGFFATFKGTADMAAVKRRFRVPAAVESTLTARVGNYFIEGHVPADDIKLLLNEKPKARGLAVPGLPLGAPGFEETDPSCEAGCTVLAGDSEREPLRELFFTLLVAPDGKTSVYARH